MDVRDFGTTDSNSTERLLYGMSNLHVHYARYIQCRNQVRYKMQKAKTQYTKDAVAENMH